MLDRENAVGFLLLGFCAVVAGVLIYSIQTGTQFRFTGPNWLGWALMLVFLGAIGYGFFANRTRRGSDGGSGPQWPDPRSGRQQGWRRWFRRGGDRDR